MFSFIADWYVSCQTLQQRQISDHKFRWTKKKLQLVMWIIGVNELFTQKLVLWKKGTSQRWVNVASMLIMLLTFENSIPYAKISIDKFGKNANMKIMCSYSSHCKSTYSILDVETTPFWLRTCDQDFWWTKKES